MKKLDGTAQKTFSDALSITTEPYCLWAIEGNEELKNTLSFCRADEGVVIAQDITKFRELKLRLLNASHTAACAIAILSGFETVYEAMQNTSFKNFLHTLMFHEIIPSLPASIPPEEAKLFARRVLERFNNEFIEHHWTAISKQSSTKITMRILPLLINTFSKNINTPAFAFAFAAFIRFMKAESSGNKLVTHYQTKEYTVEDKNAGIFIEAWKKATVQETVDEIFSAPQLWNISTAGINNFKQQVIDIIKQLEQEAVLHLLENNYK